MSQVPPRTLIGRFWTLVAVVAATDFVFGATFIYQMGRAGMSAGAIGALVAVATIASTAVEAPSGAWGDRYGQRRVLVAGIGMWGVGLVVFGLAGNVALFTVALLVWAAGMSLYSGAAGALTINRLRELGEENRVPAVVRGAQALRWSAAAGGAALVGVLGGVVSSAHLIVVSGGVLCLLALWVRLRWSESTPTGSRTVLGRLGDGIRASASGPTREIMVLAALSSCPLAVLFISWQPAAASFGLPERNFGVILLIFTVVTAGGGWASRIFGSAPNAQAILLSLVGMSACLLGAGLAQQRIVAGAFFLGAEFAAGLVTTLVAIRSQAIFTDELRNTLSSLMGTAQGIAMALMEVAFGAVWQLAGVASGLRYTATAILTLTALVCVGYAVSRIRRPAADTAAAAEAAIKS